MTDTQAQEAARLAEWHSDQAIQWRRAAAFEAADHPEPTRSMLTRKADMHADAAALLRSQAARIAELDEQIAELRKSLQRETQRTHDRNVEIIELHGENKALRAELARMREPLSDEQIKAMRNAEDYRLSFVTLREFCVIARAVEAAHGITKTGGGV